MRAGELRHLLIAEKSYRGLRDEVGDVIEEWREFAQFYGKIEHLSGQELTDARQVNGRARIKITARYEDVQGVDRTMRVRHGDRVMHIVDAADMEGRFRTTIFTCTESV